MLNIKRFEKTEDGSTLEKLLQEAHKRIAPDKEVEGYIFKNTDQALHFLADKIGSTSAYYKLREAPYALVLHPTTENGLKQTLLVTCIDEFSELGAAKNTAIAYVAPHEMGHTLDGKLYQDAQKSAKQYEHKFMAASPTALYPYEGSAGEIMIGLVQECLADKRAIDAGYAKQCIEFLEKANPDSMPEHIIFTYKMLQETEFKNRAKELEKKYWTVKRMFEPKLIEQIYKAGAHLNYEKLAGLLLSPA